MNVVSYDLERRARLLAQMMSELLVELRTFTPENPITPEFCERFAKINNEQKVLANEMGESLAGSKG